MTESQHARRWLILAAVALAQPMIVLDVTVAPYLPSVGAGRPLVRRQLAPVGDLRRRTAFGSLLLLGERISDLVGRRVGVRHWSLGFARASAAAGRRRALNCWSPPVPSRAALQPLPPTVPSILTTTLTDPAGTNHGVRRIRRDWRLRRRARPAPRRHPHSVSRQALDDDVTVAFAAPPSLAAARSLDSRAPATRPRIHVPGVLLGVSGSVRAGVRIRQRQGARLERSAHGRAADLRRGGAGRLRGSRAPGRPSAASAHRGARPQPRRGASGDRHHRADDVRHVSVPHLLPPADAQLLPYPDRAGVPPDGGHGRNRPRRSL